MESPIVTQCGFCKKKFQTTAIRIASGRGKFCSKRCMYQSRKGLTPPNKKYATPFLDVSCEICKKVFKVRTAWYHHRIRKGKTRFACSPECVSKLKSITIKEVRSKPASRAKTVAQLRERWSDPAEHKRWSKLAKEKSAEWHPALKAKRRHCDYCGKLYRHYNNGRSRFCSRKCEKAACTVTVHCRICKKAIQKERSVVKTRSTKSFFCSPKCYAKGVSWWMKRAHRRDPKLRHRMSYSQRRFHKAHPGFWQQLHKQHPELKGKISRGLKSYYSNHPEARVNVRKFLRSFLGKQNPSGIELMVRRFLRKQFPGQFRHTGQNYRSLVLQFVPDFVSKNKQILIFVDGCFYHNCPEHGNALSKKFVRHSVQERDSKLTKAGYKVVAVWEHELKSPDWQAKLKSRLDALLGSSIPTPA